MDLLSGRTVFWCTADRKRKRVGSLGEDKQWLWNRPSATEGQGEVMAAAARKAREKKSKGIR